MTRPIFSVLTVLMTVISQLFVPFYIVSYRIVSYRVLKTQA